MIMEGLENNVTNEEVIVLLQKKLTELNEALQKVEKVEDNSAADDEDDTERKEDNEERTATKDLLKKDIENTERKIAWVENNGDKCASPNCNNKVGAGRRKLGGVTCPEHMDEEERTLEELEITS